MKTTTPFVYFDIDTQRDFMYPEGALYVPGAEKLEFALNTLKNQAVRYGVPILSSVDAHPAEDPEFEHFPPHCVVHTEGQTKIPGTLTPNVTTVSLTSGARETITPQPQVIVEKNVFDVFQNPYTARFLEHHAPRTVVVAGVATDYCVKAAVLGLLERGREVWLATDAIAGVSDQATQACVSDFTDQGVKLIHTAQICAHWQASYSAHQLSEVKL